MRPNRSQLATCPHSAETDELEVTLNTVLTLANGRDHACRCLSRSVIAAFISFVEVEALPDPGADWINLMKRHFQGVPEAADPALSSFIQLARIRVDDAPGAPRILHALFQDSQGVSYFDRWTITATLLLLIHVGDVPKCPDEWRARLRASFKSAEGNQPVIAERDFGDVNCA